MNSDIPVNRLRAKPRLGPDGRAQIPWSGGTTARIATVLAPDAEECRGLLLEMRRKTGFSRGLLAAFLGVPPATLRRWEERKRSPSGAAKRAIWLLHWLLFETERSLDEMVFLTWGRKPKAAGNVDLASPG